MSKKTFILKDLAPNTQYAVQVRSTYPHGGYGPWSPTVYFTTSNDTTAPAAPSNLQISFQDRSFTLTWDAPTANEDGSTIQDFMDYEVTVHPSADPANKRQFYTSSNSFEFTYHQNSFFFGTAQGDLMFEVRSRDAGFNVSTTPATIQGQAAQLLPITITAEGRSRAVEIYWDHQGAADHYNVYRSATAGVTITDANFLGSTMGTEVGKKVSYYDIPGGLDPFYYKVVGVGVFGDTEISNEASAAPTSDVGAPAELVSQPAPPEVTGGIHNLLVRHTMKKADGVTTLEADLTHFEVYAKNSVAPDTTSTASPDFIGRIPANVNNAVAEETFIYIVGASTTVHVAVKAANKDGAASAASTVVTATVKPVDNSTYIANATIIDAHIQNVSANKLQANTAIVNSLDISALLTVKAGGFLQAGNYNSTNKTGWRIGTDAGGYGVIEAYDGLFHGTIQATAGFLDSLKVRNTITVGDGTIAGAIQSSNYGASSGWKIDSAGALTAYSATIRGTIQATAGYLTGLSVTGSITVGQTSTDTSSILKAYNSKWWIRGDGKARFEDVYVQGDINAGSGRFYGNVNIESGGYLTMTGGSGSIIRTNSTGARLELRGDGVLLFYNAYGDWWSMNTTGQDNLLLTSSNTNDGARSFTIRSNGQLMKFHDHAATILGMIEKGGSWLFIRGGSTAPGLWFIPAASNDGVAGRLDLRSIDRTAYTDFRARILYAMEDGTAQKVATETWVTNNTGGTHTHSEYASSTHSHSYLPTSGGTMSGNITFGSSSYRIGYSNAFAHFSARLYSKSDTGASQHMDCDTMFYNTLSSKSDSAAKQNIAQVQKSMKPTMKKLQFFDYQYKDKPNVTKRGIMADNFKDEDFVFYDDLDKVWRLKFDDFVMVGMQALTETIADVEALQQEVHDLKDRLAAAGI